MTDPNGGSEEPLAGSLPAAGPDDPHRDRRLLQAVADNATVALLIMDQRQRCVFMNRAAERLTGYTFAEVQGRRLHDVVHHTRPDGRPYPLDECPIDRAFPRNSREQGEEVFVHRDGHFYPVAYTASPIRSAPTGSGEAPILGTIIEVRDIARERAAEAALRESEARFRALSESAPVAILLLDPDGLCRYANPAWSRLSGRDRADALGTGWLQSIHPEDRDAVARAWTDAAEAPSLDAMAPLEFRCAQPGGDVRYARGESAPVRASDGVPLGVVATVVDTSERREAEEQLRQVQQMQAVGQLAGGMAHELNNLLCASMGMAAFALRALPPDHAAAHDVRESLRAQERAARITSQVLSFSRRQMLVGTDFDLGTAVRELEPLLRQSLGPAHALRIAPTVGGMVHADRSQFEQALLNLVVNARDAMPDGGTIVIEDERPGAARRRAAEPDPKLADGRYVVLAVRDGGTGMDAATRLRAFEPFFTTKPQGQGTGLGLSQVYGFARQSGGAVTLESEVGQGTTVRLFLPLVAAAAEVRAAAPAAVPDAAAPGAEPLARGLPSEPGRRGLALLIDDEALVRAVARRTLELEGYGVLEASSGPDAFALLEREGDAVQLVVCDLVMPGMPGEQVGAVIGQRWPAVPVLYMSGHPGAADVMRRLPAGAVLLPKPFDPDTLASRVRELHARRTDAPAVLVVHDDTATLYWLQRCLTRAGYRVVTDSDLFQALTRVRDDGGIRLLVADWHLGYVDAAMLVHEVRARDPEFPVLIVTMWPERYERIRARLPDDVQVVFSPIDEARLLSIVGGLWRDRPPSAAT